MSRSPGVPGFHWEIVNKLEIIWNGKSGFFLTKIDCHFHVFYENMRKDDEVFCETITKDVIHDNKIFFQQMTMIRTGEDQ